MSDPTYVIYSTSESAAQREPMYWSNKFGWGPIDQASFFTYEEIDKVKCPMPDGIWIMANDPYDPNWDNDLVQFARFITEINANVLLSEEEWNSLLESMDITKPLARELVERAEEVFSAAKHRLEHPVV